MVLKLFFEKPSKIVVLRLGHRRDRDKRITTHVGLVARAFGADGIIVSGEEDKTIIDSLSSVVENWGGNFYISYEKNWKSILTKYKREKWLVIHLTMYGLNINVIEKELRDLFFKKKCNFLVVVGAEKVPKELYEIADYNVAIGNQPHSEVAALAVFLDRLFKGKELETEFPNARLKIVPQKRGKKVIFVGDQ